MIADMIGVRAIEDVPDTRQIGRTWLGATRQDSPILVPTVGFELTTYRLQGGCSTPELCGHDCTILRGERNLRRKNGARNRSRTYDLRITNALLYQLSYSGVPFAIDPATAIAKPIILAAAGEFFHRLSLAKKYRMGVRASRGIFGMTASVTCRR